MRRVGVGYREQLSDWLATRPPEVRCLEITAEHFFDSREQTLAALAEMYPMFVHGLGLSLGTPEPLDRETLRRFARVATAAKAEWVSEHVAFTRTVEVDLGHLNPVPLTYESLQTLVDHAQEVAEACNRPLILENITTELRFDGDMPETEFLNRMCEEAKCGLLLDVTNLYINSRNHGYDAASWLNEIEPSHIVQLHVVGYSRHGSRYHDGHAARIQPDLMELVQRVVEYAPVQAITLERDARLNEIEEIVADLRRLEQACDSS